MNKAPYCAVRVALARLFLGAASIPSAVLAQGAPAEEAGGLEEVVVTAQFRKSVCRTRRSRSPPLPKR